MSVRSYGNIQFCKGTTSPSCYFWPQDMIPSCGLHTSIDKRNLPSGMTLEEKPAKFLTEFRGKITNLSQRCQILTGIQLITTF